MKVNVSLDEGLLLKADSFAEENYISRSSLISLALTQYLSADELKKAMVNLSAALNRIASSGSFTNEDKKEIADIVTVCRFLSRPNDK